jgi:hypothetical protein
VLRGVVGVVEAVPEVRAHGDGVREPGHHRGLGEGREVREEKGLIHDLLALLRDVMAPDQRKAVRLPVLDRVGRLHRGEKGGQGLRHVLEERDDRVAPLPHELDVVLAGRVPEVPLELGAVAGGDAVHRDGLVIERPARLDRGRRGDLALVLVLELVLVPAGRRQLDVVLDGA